MNMNKKITYHRVSLDYSVTFTSTPSLVDPIINGLMQNTDINAIYVTDMDGNLENAWAPNHV